MCNNENGVDADVDAARVVVAQYRIGAISDPGAAFDEIGRILGETDASRLATARAIVDRGGDPKFMLVDLRKALGLSE